MPDLKEKLQLLPASPGVYRFFDEHGEIIYVGKAKQLKKRVQSYFRDQLDTAKTRALMSKVVDLEVTVTETENQALLLESNLIKANRPRYNVVLRDDKSYPYLFISTKDPFPRIDFYRGIKKERGDYFGPYPSAGSVRQNLSLIQKLFRLRTCQDVFFSHRTRPCLQYQIGRCTAPCVGNVKESDYRLQVEDALQFLRGRDNEVIDLVQKRMEAAANILDFEKAAYWRDLLIRLQTLRRAQSIVSGKSNVDVFAIAKKHGRVAIAIVSVRHGHLLGHQTFFPNLPVDMSVEEALSAFLPQYYLNSVRLNQRVDRIVIAHHLKERAWLESALREAMGSGVVISLRLQAVEKEWLLIAEKNVQQALAERLAEKEAMARKFESLQAALGLEHAIKRVECFDISHSSGEATKASCVVFGKEGPIRKAYRQFDIKDITPGDDYAAMYQAITRRYSRLLKENSALPCVLVIDGGLGQMKKAAEALTVLGIDTVMILGVAKGPTRKPGEERLFLWQESTEIDLPPEDEALHLIQFIRDEAHRFAITAHRKKRSQSRLQSRLDQISGIGAKRKIALLQFFGGLQQLKAAGVSEIAKVPGVSEALAKRIYQALQEEY